MLYIFTTEDTDSVKTKMSKVKGRTLATYTITSPFSVCLPPYGNYFFPKKLTRNSTEIVTGCSRKMHFLFALSAEGHNSRFISLSPVAFSQK